MCDDDGSTCGKPADGGGEAATRDDGADTMMTTPAGKQADGGEAAMRDDDASGCGSGQRMEVESRRPKGRLAAAPFFLFAMIFSQASESSSCENRDVACKNYFRRQAGGPYPPPGKTIFDCAKTFFLLVSNVFPVQVLCSNYRIVELRVKGFSHLKS